MRITSRLAGGHLAVLQAHVPGAAERTYTAEADGARPRGQLERRDGLEHLASPVGLEAEQDLQQEHRRARGPGLRPRGRWILDRERRVASREAREHLRELVAERARRVEHRAHDAVRLRPARVPRQAPGAERVVVWPDGAVVVAEGVESRVAAGHRPDAPAGPQLLPHQPVDDGVDAFRRDDATPQQVADVRAQRVDLLLLTVERERVVAAAIVDPERLVEAPAQLPPPAR